MHADWSSNPEEVLLSVREALGFGTLDCRIPALLGQVGSLYMYTRVDSPGMPALLVASPFLAFTSSDIVKHFRLTPTQAIVAGLLACRRSNAEIASALNISPNTARRHTEAVMFRMRASSRSDVERLIKERLSSAAIETSVVTPKNLYDR